jgi:primosomal protein N' (replication factor Y)
LPAAQPYRYRIPTAMADRVVPGMRVVVPVRARELVGLVSDVSGEAGVDALKPVLLVPDDAPLLSDHLLSLGAWVSRYYAAPPGLTFRAIVPPALWGASRLVARLHSAEGAGGGLSAEVVAALQRAGGKAAAQTLSRKLRRPVWEVLQRLARAGVLSLETEPPDLGPRAGRVKFVVLAASLPSLMERERAFGRATRQRALYESVDALGGEADTRHVTGALGFGAAVIKGLVDRGFARIEERESLRDPFRDVSAPPPGEPTPRQREAMAALESVPGGGAALLFGVTGSGKTLVYLEQIRTELAQGKGAIVLVPEISLTPQTVARVRGAFGNDVAVLHSQLSDAERADAWRAVATGQRRVVVGARSAVFAPVPRLGLIVVDEEHDASYKQGEMPRYHARDVALARARREGARVVLGSATPSLETWARRDRLRLVTLPERIAARPLPQVKMIDLRHEPRVTRAGAVPWSEALDRAVEARLTAAEQVILLLNRRGFAHYLQCPACGFVRHCPSCSIALTVHVTPPSLRCHYCGHDEPVPVGCEQCGQATQKTRGVGTQLLERWLASRYPAARLARMDADTTSGKWSHHRTLDAVGRREIDILFGTQMIAKGLDFPGVTLVGVVDADGGLHLPDFRAAERTFQLVAQVAGRAGRGADPGEVLVQTRSPLHAALVSAATHDFEGFAEHELNARRAPAYPPHVGLVNVIVSGENQAAVTDAALATAQWLRQLVAARGEGLVEVVGPSPAPLERVQRRWRWHLLLRSTDSRQLGRIIRYASQRAPYAKRGGEIRTVFDRDPVSLL